MPDPKGKLVVPCGFLASGVLRALALDANDYLKVAVAAYVAGTLTEVAGKDSGATVRELLVSTTGRLLIDPGGADKLFAYENNAPPNERIGGVLVAGTNTFTSTVIPTGKVAVVTHLSFIYTGTPGNMEWQLTKLVGSSLRIFRQFGMTTNYVYDRQGWWVLKEGEYMSLVIYGSTADDVAYGYIGGFSMDAP